MNKYFISFLAGPHQIHEQRTSGAGGLLEAQHLRLYLGQQTRRDGGEDQNHHHHYHSQTYHNCWVLGFETEQTADIVYQEVYFEW